MTPRAVALTLAVALAAACGGARGAGRGGEVIDLPVVGRGPPPVASVANEPSSRAPGVDPKIIRAIGPVEIGQTVVEVRERLGQELKRSTHDEEYAAFKSFNYDPARVVAFIIGFDEVLVFNEDTPRTEPPIWKVYVKNDRAVLLKITTVGFEDHLRAHRVGFPPSCYLLESPQGIFDTFGQRFQEEEVPDHKTYHFVDRGISVMVFDDAIRVFDVFGDVGDAMRATIRSAFASPASTD